jgi:hypothetical protein
MSLMVLTPRRYDREGAHAVIGTMAFPANTWRIFRHQSILTNLNILP